MKPKSNSRLEEIRERLIERNSRYNYSQTISKYSDKYFELLLEIRKRKTAIWNANRNTNQNYAHNLAVAKGNITNSIMRGLTEPSYEN